VLFGSSKAHIALRQLLVDDNQLDAVISLPSGVFKPYAGVSTAILLFTKGGNTSDVFFFEVRADGFSLDDKRNPVEANDLPELLERWKTRDEGKDTDRTSKAFYVPAAEIREQKYDLSLNRYKLPVYTQEEYDPPLVILERMESLEKEIVEHMVELREMLR
jgi:Type I restriction-modification system methyltransferase subunit